MLRGAGRKRRPDFLQITSSRPAGEPGYVPRIGANSRTAAIIQLEGYSLTL